MEKYGMKKVVYYQRFFRCMMKKSLQYKGFFVGISTWQADPVNDKGVYKKDKSDISGGHLKPP